MISDLNITKPLDLSGYDVCICGAGVTGISIAIRLANSGLKIALFEAGGLQYSQQSQEVYAATTTSENYRQAVNSCRQRFLGGTSNHWGGRCKPFQEFDFLSRPWFELPGWPIELTELTKYTRDANQVLNLNADESFKPYSEPASWVSDKFSLDSAVYAESPVRFKDKYLEQIKKSEQIDLYINANLTEIRLTSQKDSVDKIKIQNYNGDVYYFSGKQTVLSMGSIENARMLLNSNAQNKQGIGNHNDMVGRCFMEHLNIRFGNFVSNNEFLRSGEFLDLVTTATLSRSNQIGSSENVYRFNSSAREQAGSMQKKIRNSVCKSETATRLTRLLKDFDCPDDGSVYTQTEQEAHLNNRVRLTSETSHFGLQGVILDLALTEMDKRTIRVSVLESAKEFARLGFGRVHLNKYILDDSKEIPLKLGLHCHQMGTTRMSSEPRYGVVDSNCRVFDIGNLYIGGSSVFSTGGANNPTYPIVQLSLRLADHLASLAG